MEQTASEGDMQGAPPLPSHSSWGKQWHIQRGGKALSTIHLPGVALKGKGPLHVLVWLPPRLGALPPLAMPVVSLFEMALKGWGPLACNGEKVTDPSPSSYTTEWLENKNLKQRQLY